MLRISGGQGRLDGARRTLADVPSEALTTPALLSQREMREKEKQSKKFFLFPSLPPGERGQGSEGFGGHVVSSGRGEP